MGRIISDLEWLLKKQRERHTINIKLWSLVSPSSSILQVQLCFSYDKHGLLLECHGTDATSVRRPVLRGARVVFELDLFPQLDEVVQPPQIPVLVVPLHPRRAVVDGGSLGQGNCLAKVNEMDTTQISAVVDKQ